jgi:hypothetical protein
LFTENSGGLKMSLKEAIEVINEYVPMPGSKMIDQSQMKLVWAWYHFLREFKSLENENLIPDEKYAEKAKKQDEMNAYYI